MGRWKVGSLTAAIGCIALGVVIVLAQYDKITYAALGYLWPALLIVFGLEMLGRLLIRSDVKTRVSGWAIVLIVLLIGASAGQSILAGGSLSSLLGNMKLTPVKGTMEINSQITTVRIALPDGKVKVQGVEGNSVAYEGSLLSPGNTPEDAKKALEKKWKVEVDGDTLVLELEEEANWLAGLQFGFNSNDPYLNVEVPANLAVEIATSNGSIDAFELKSGLTAHTSNGTMDLHDITGNVEGRSSNGSLTVKNIQGDVDLVSSNGAINAEQIGGKLSAESSNGKITVHSPVADDWKCTSSNGKVVLELPAGADAKITADTSNGSLQGNVPWDRDGDNHGTAVLAAGTHTIEVSTSNGSVTVNTVE